jgi:nicotinate dehydrogenase subunit B
MTNRVPSSVDLSTDAPGLWIQGGAALGFPPPASGYARGAYGNVTPEYGPSPWLVVRPDGRVTAFAGKVEYGQGIRWGLAVEVADELRLPLSAVEVILGDTATTPWDMGTFGSQSTWRTGLQLRKAAATARQTLLDLASSHLDLPVADLFCADGVVRSKNDASHAISYGDLIGEERMLHDLIDTTPLTPESEFTVMGHDSARIDAIARVTGEAVFSQDIQRPGMLFASILRPPSYGAKLDELDTAIAEQMPGVVQVIRDGSLVAVLAESDEQAEAAIPLIRADWTERTAHVSRWDLPTLLDETASDPATTQEAGNLDEGFAAAEHILESTYFIPYVSIAPMEPRAAVAEWDGDSENSLLTVWAGTQRPFGTRAELGEHFAIDESRIRVIAPEIGGGFGGKSIYRPALEAARLARIAQRPVRIAYTRDEEMFWSTFRPAALIKIRSGFDAQGTLLAWDFHAAHTTADRPMIGQRGSETPYDVPHNRVVVAAAASPLRPGSYRSLGGSVNHFAREVHMDEIAVTVGVDPVELRLRNLSHPRFRAVLESAAEQFGWDPAPQPSNRGVGVALGLDVGSYVAACVELDVQGKEVHVRRVSASLDCGLTVNPSGARNQVEGSVVMGLGTALYEGADFEGGRLLNGSFARYRVPRSNNIPRIDVALIGDPEVPSTGAGEPAIVAVAPAIANAVFDQTGVRHRELPIQRFL